MRTFEFNDGKSHKFWNIELSGSSFTVTFGKVGAKGQSQTKEFPSVAAAQKAHDKLVAEKVGKGYTETTAGGAPTPTPAAGSREVSALQRSMEEALVEDPDDLATLSAYADYLMDQGDPRGEFIQVQLSLADPAHPAKEIDKVRQREAELLRQHAREWLGDLGRFLVGSWSGPDKPFHYHFARGWLDTLRFLPAPDAMFTVLANAPEVRLLRRLEIVYDMRYHPFDFDDYLEGPTKALTEEESDSEIYEEANLLPPLLESPYLSNLRVFKLGFSDNDDRPRHSTMISVFEDCKAAQIVTLLEKCPRLEELYLNTDLAGIRDLFASPALGPIRVLQYYYGSVYSYSGQQEGYPLSVLANNTALKNLTTLRLHAGRETTLDAGELEALMRSPNLPRLAHLQAQMTEYGDEGARRIVASGILRRLRSLDIGFGNMTDEGARILAECPDLRHLHSLDVSRNCLTNSGISALRATGVRVIANAQHDGEENEYLYEVDVE